ncbi:MAG: hypothetical protein ACYDAJ_00390 [Nitrosotalea sp.]
MNNEQIRLSILSQYYRAKFNGKGYGEREENPELKNIPRETINANMEYLVDKGLINGKKTYVSGGIMVSPTDITARGMDVVENILKQSLEKLDQNVISEIKKESSTNKKLDKLFEISSKAEPVLEIVVKIAGMIFSNLR